MDENCACQAALLLDKPEHLFKESRCARTKVTIRGQNKGDEQSIACPNRRLDPGVAHLSHFDISKKGLDKIPHVLAAAPHGRVTREASHGHVYQNTHARRIKTKQVGPPGAGMLGRTRILKSALNAAVHVAAFIALQLQNFAIST